MVYTVIIKFDKNNNCVLKLKKNEVIIMDYYRKFQKLLALLLLGVVTFGNVGSYQKIVFKDQGSVIQIQPNSKSSGLDIGKAD